MPRARMATPEGFSAVSFIIPHRKPRRPCSQVTDEDPRSPENCRMTAESLARVMEEFLGGARNTVVLEDGARIFDLQDSKYSISGE